MVVPLLQFFFVHVSVVSHVVFVLSLYVPPPFRFQYLHDCAISWIPSLIFGSIVYNRAIVYKRHNFLKVVVHVIIIDQCNQTAR